MGGDTVRVRGIDAYVSKDCTLLEAMDTLAALSGIPASFIFDGNDVEAWADAVERSDVGWIARYETDLPAFPFKFDINLVNGEDPLALVRSLGHRLGQVVAIPDDDSPSSDDFVFIEPDGTMRKGSLR